VLLVAYALSIIAIKIPARAKIISEARKNMPQRDNALLYDREYIR